MHVKLTESIVRIEEIIVVVEQAEDPNDDQGHDVEGVLLEEQLPHLYADTRAHKAFIGEDDGVEADQHEQREVDAEDDVVHVTDRPGWVSGRERWLGQVLSWHSLVR